MTKARLMFITIVDDYGNETEPMLHYWDEELKKWVEVESYKIHKNTYNEFINQPKW